ncbi:ABC transporter permease [Allokutzneria multivorans]|uniref:ABC transporter permease n=1 Tax=Allokutzneria multivorans TaxID=1142134 RepID=UPI0031EFEC89
MTGTWRLVRLVLRRERVVLPAWVGLVLLMIIGMVPYYDRRLPSAEARQALVDEVVGNRVLLGFGGEIAGPDLGSLVAWKIGDPVYSLVGVFVLLMVVRHTRAEEDAGRAELLGAGVVGRHAQLTATVLVTVSACLAVGVLSALGMVALGVEPVGTVAFGLCVVAPGVVFAAVAALAAQLAGNARSASVLAAGVLGAGYVVRFVGDASGEGWLRWFSPQGWSHLVDPYGERAWAVFLVPAVVAGLVLATAYVVNGRRDLGVGVLPARQRTSKSVRGPLALAWRLHRGLLAGWSLGFLAVGLLLGGVASDVPDLAERAGEVVKEFFARYADSPTATLGDAFLWLIVLLMGYTAALYPVLATLRLRTEESSGRAEALLATEVSRVRWAASHLVFSVLGSAVVLGAGGLAAGLASGRVGALVEGALVQLPAVWIVGGVAALAVGVLPRQAAAIGWSTWVFVNVFGEIVGPAMGIDYWVADLVVPFHHLPKVLSGGALEPAPLLLMTGLAALLLGMGLIGLRRRDLG